MTVAILKSNRTVWSNGLIEKPSHFINNYGGPI